MGAVKRATCSAGGAAPVKMSAGEWRTKSPRVRARELLRAERSRYVHAIIDDISYCAFALMDEALVAGFLWT